jgi:hypothetical protein
MSRIHSTIALMCGLAAVGAAPAFSQDHENDEFNVKKHVLLVSIDGMHAVDLHRCVLANTCPNLASLVKAGVNYTRTSTSKPSDSFPGLMALVTGGTPKTVGAYYDVAYDRVLAPPTITTGNGLLGGQCAVGKANGTRTEYEEGDDIDKTKLNGGGPYSTLDGGFKSLDPKKLVRDPFHGCEPVYPWNFIRANTVFGVIHQAGGYTAWADKHAAYSAVSGPTGTSTPSNVDDYYSPDINSNLIPLPGVKTAGGLDCSTIPNNNGGDWTGDFDNVKCNDQLKVNAVLNWIQGNAHLGGDVDRVPNIFGMNFQAVSIGQKLIENGVKGGYLDAAATPSQPLLGEIKYVDGAIGQFVAELKKQNLLQSTTIIITAKHGQSPIDPNRFSPIPGGTGTNGAPPSSILGPSYLPDSELNQIGPTEDDISLLWLKTGTSASTAVDLLENKASEAGIGQIFDGAYLEAQYDKPGLPWEGGDPRTPDIIVQPHVGVIYTGSTKKQEEHGGFAQDDTNVMLLVSNPSLHERTITSFVETTQVAPTILEVLGLNPWELEAVRKEGTPVLPGLNSKD